MHDHGNCARCDSQDGEIERLKDALEEIAGHWNGLENPMATLDAAKQAERVARAALAGGKVTLPPQEPVTEKSCGCYSEGHDGMTTRYISHCRLHAHSSALLLALGELYGAYRDAPHDVAARARRAIQQVTRP